MRYRELLSAVLSDGVGGRAPAAAWQHHPVADQETEAFADATLAFQARHDCDFVKLTPASTWQSRDRGLQDAWEGDFIGRRKVVSQAVTSVDAWDRLGAIHPCAGFSGRIVAAAAKVRRALPVHVPVIATVFNPLFQATQLRGFDGVLADAMAEPARLRRALDVLRDGTVAMINALRDAGVDGIFYVAQHAHAGAMTAEAWRDLALGDDLACLDACAGLPFNFLHLHGSAIHASLYAGCGAVLHYDHSQDNPAADALIGEFPTGLSTGPCAHTALMQASSAEIVEGALQLRQAMAGERFVLAPGCAVPLGVPAARIDALLWAARSPLRAAA